MSAAHKSETPLAGGAVANHNALETAPIIADTKASALVHLHHGKPVTDSLAIAREFGRRHDNVLQTLDSLAAGGWRHDRSP